MEQLENQEEQFDWNAFLNKSSYTLDELRLARKLSESWVTCAVGVQCNIIPRDRHDIPLDNILRGLGEDFWKAMYNMYFEEEACKDIHFIKEEAKQILKKIELRSVFLINQEAIKK